MAQESKSSDNNKWDELEKTTNITLNNIINGIRKRDESAALTIGLFHDKSQTPEKNRIFSTFAADIDIGANAIARDALYKYSILDCKPLTASIRQIWVNSTTTFSPAMDRCVGCMVGMAIGDAVGHPLEFVAITSRQKPLETRPRFSYKQQKYFNEYNKFRLERGQWTDDAAMGVCIADSLIVCDGYKGSDIRIRFWNWWQNGYNNAFRWDETRNTHSSVGLGGNISSSIFSCESGVVPSARYEVEHDREDSGNGSLMRLAPVPLFFHSDIVKAREFSFESSFTTHPGYIAAEACSLLAFIIIHAIHPTENDIEIDPAKHVKKFIEIVIKKYADILQRENQEIQEKIDTMKSTNKQEKTEQDVDVKLLRRQLDAKGLILRLMESAEVDNKETGWNWKNEYGALPIIDCYHVRCGGEDIPYWARDEYNGYPVSPEYWGSYCLDGMSIALHCVYNSVCFGDAIEKCVCLLGDADTTAAITGQIAGAIYGYQSIIEEKEQKFMVDQLNKWDQNGFAFRGVLLYILGDESINS